MKAQPTDPTNVKHSSAKDDWMTPQNVIEAARLLMGGFDLDPASSAQANERVRATRFIGKEEDGLAAPWSNTLGVRYNVFLNPPGSKKGNRSISALFWERLMREYASGSVSEAVFVGFSLEQLQTTQGKGVPAMTQFPFCIPEKRLRFVDPDGSGKNSPSHANVIVYVPRLVGTTGWDGAKVRMFHELFQPFGSVIVP